MGQVQLLFPSEVSQQFEELCDNVMCDGISVQPVELVFNLNHNGEKLEGFEINIL